MADPKTYVETATGDVRTVTSPEQAQRLSDAGRAFVGTSEARGLAGQEADAAAVEHMYGSAGLAALGAADTATMGLLPGALAGLAPDRAWELQAADKTGAYGAGQVLGMLPYLFEGNPLSGVGSFAERWALKGLPEVSSALGKAGRSALSMAARGASEGAFIDVSNTIGKSLVNNTPLTAQALAAHGLEGALLGGVFGGVMGGAGGFLGAGLEGAAGTMAKSGKGALFRRIGASGEDILRMEAEEGLEPTLSKLYEQLQASGGKNFRNATSEDLYEAAKSINRNTKAAKADLAELLQREAPGLVPSQERVSKLVGDVVSKYSGELAEREASTIGNRLRSDIENIKGKPQFSPIYEDIASGIKPEFSAKKTASGIQPEAKLGPGYSEIEMTGMGFIPKGPEIPGVSVKHVPSGMDQYTTSVSSFSPSGENVEGIVGKILSGYDKASWEKWFSSRDFLRNKIGSAVSNPTLAKKIESEVLAVLDSELTSSLEAASEVTSRKGIANQWSSLAAAERMAEHLEEMTGRSYSQGMTAGGGSYLSPGDAKTVALGLGFGGPVGGVKGAAIVAGKGLASMLQDYIEPIVAQKAYEMMVGAKAAGAVAETRKRINTATKGFFSGKKAATRSSVEAISTRQSFDKKLERAAELSSPQHQARVNQYVDMVRASQQAKLADEIYLTNLRAVQYLQFNMPISPKVKQAGSIREMPSKWGLDQKDWKFNKIFDAISKPLAILDNLEDGTITSDEVRAVKYVYPELHQEMVQGISNGIMEMKAEGKYLPIDKITQLGIAMDAPIDSTLEPEYISAVQASFSYMPPDANGNPPPQQQVPIQQATIDTGLLTPTQAILV